MSDTLDTKNGKPFEASDEYLYQKKIDELNLRLDIATGALEAVRSQMCWEMDRDQLTMGMCDLHQTVTEALERINEK